MKIHTTVEWSVIVSNAIGTLASADDLIISTVA